MARRDSLIGHVPLSYLTPRVTSANDATVITDIGSGGKRRPPQAWSGDSDVDMEAQRLKYLHESLAPDTHVTYNSHQRRWAAYRAARGEHWLMPEGLTQREYEDILMTHVTYCARVANLAASTIEGRLAAIVRLHVENYIMLDRAQMPLLGLVVRGIKRLQGGCSRKFAVTIDILEELMSRSDDEDWDDYVTTTAALTGFFFLLRSTEYLDVGTAANFKMRLRTAHVCLRANGVDLDLTKPWKEGDPIPDEMLITLPYSKTDMEGQGREINLFSDPGNPMCVVGRLHEMWKRRPRYFTQPEASLFRTTLDKPIKKEHLQDKLREAAKALNYDADDFSSHSLRAGGATAMYHADVPIEDIQRRGRWKSDCWRIYIFGDRNRARGLFQKMSAKSVSLFAATRLRRRD